MAVRAKCAVFGMFLRHYRYSGRTSLCGKHSRNANEIISGCGEDEKPFDQVASAVAGLAQTTHGFHPAERFLDALKAGEKR